MASLSTEDWNIGQRSGLVSIGTHKLFLSVSGPDRIPGRPVIVLFLGVTSSLAEWPVAIRMIASANRVVAHDRASYGQSEDSPHLPTPETIVAETSALLRAAGIDPPFILLGHSWGGILITEFMLTRPDDVAGMVYVDPVGPDPHNEEQAPWKCALVMAVQGDVNYRAITCPREKSPLSSEQYDAWIEEEAREAHQRQAIREHLELDRSYAALAQKGVFHRQPPVLGNRPVCVLYSHSDQDNEQMYAAGVQAGHGTEEQRATYRQMLEVWAERERTVERQYLTLSTNSRWMEADWCGHMVHIMEPDKIANAVKWAVEHLV